MVEAGDAGGGTGTHRHLHAGHPQGDVTELGRGGEAAERIAPRAGDADVLVLIGEGELGAGELAADLLQPLAQGAQVRHHQLHVTRQHVGRAGGQVELRLPGVGPHVFRAHHEVGIAREAEPRDVEAGGDHLVGHAHVHVLEKDDIADVLGAPVEVASGHDRSPLL